MRWLPPRGPRQLPAKSSQLVWQVSSIHLPPIFYRKEPHTSEKNHSRHQWPHLPSPGHGYARNLILPGNQGPDILLSFLRLQASRLLINFLPSGFMLLTGQGYEKRSEENTSELQSLMRISYDVFCLKKKK